MMISLMNKSRTRDLLDKLRVIRGEVRDRRRSKVIAK